MASSSAPLLRPCLPHRAGAGAPEGGAQHELARVRPMDTGLHYARESVTPPAQVRLDHRPPPQPPSQQQQQQQQQQPRSPPLNPVITLDHKRDGPRHQNLYVDTPRNTAVFNGVSSSNSSHSQLQQHPPAAVISSQPISSSTATSPVTSSSLSSSSTREETAIFTEPHTPAGLKKDAHDKDAINATKREIHTDSIICQKCGKCKCKACTHPEPSTKDCSPNKVVDCCSCLYCVQCVFYHCFKDSETNDDMCSADDPCACCERPHCLKRWTCMGIMSLCLPCLCFYWPLKGIVNSCTAVHNRCSRKGCHCRKDNSKVPSLNKRLLIPDSESSST